MENKKLIEHILVPLDGSSLAECVLPHAVALTQAFDARITLLRAVGHADADGSASVVDPLDWKIRRAEAQSYLDDVAARLEEIDLEAETAVPEGPAAKRILEFAQDQDIDLIVISSHGRSGLSEWNVNSVVQKVILWAYAPVLIVRAYRPVQEELTGLHYRRLMAPLDGSQRAEHVLPLATSLADFHECPLYLTHVVHKPELPRHTPPSEEEIDLADRLTEINRKKAAAYLEELADRYAPRVQARVVVADEVSATLHNLVEEEDIDLVILSAHGYTGAGGWPYGSVALDFIAYGRTPLLILQDLPREELQKTPAERAAQEKKGH